MAWNVVIAGGGFGGAHAARQRERLLPKQSAGLMLVNDVNFLLYTPFLPEAAAGTLEPRHVVTPLRDVLEQTRLRLGVVTGRDPARRTITMTDEEQVDHELPYDHVIGCLEAADASEDAAATEELLTFVFVGGGYAGLEALAELQDFAAEAMKFYPRARLHGMRWVLVEATDRVLPEIDDELAEYAARELRSRGIDIRLGTTLEEATGSSARISTGETIPSRTLVWPAGVVPHPSGRNLGLPIDDRGRIVVDEYLRV